MATELLSLSSFYFPGALIDATLVTFLHVFLLAHVLVMLACTVEIKISSPSENFWNNEVSTYLLTTNDTSEAWKKHPIFVKMCRTKSCIKGFLGRNLYFWKVYVLQKYRFLYVDHSPCWWLQGKVTHFNHSMCAALFSFLCKKS